ESEDGPGVRYIAGKGGGDRLADGAGIGDISQDLAAENANTRRVDIGTDGGDSGPAGRACGSTGEGHDAAVVRDIAGNLGRDRGVEGADIRNIAADPATDEIDAEGLRLDNRRGG